MGARIRMACPSDYSDLETIEASIWTKRQVQVFGREYFQAWLETNPQGFWVAERRGMVRAYLYFQTMLFTPANLSAPFSRATDRGFTSHSHEPQGDGFYIVSICSTGIGLGLLLIDWLYRKSEKEGKKACGLSRLPGFSSYYSKLEPAQKREYSEKEIAAHYAFSTASKVSGQREGGLIPLLPAPERPDPVLANFLRQRGVFLSGVTYPYFPDPDSRDFAAIVLANY